MTPMYDRVKAVSAALAQIGWRYQSVDAAHDAMTAGAVDCSGSTLLAARAGGLELPHQSAQQSIAPRVHTFGPGRYGGRWMREWLKPGDLVFFYGGKWPEGREQITHVAMYVGIQRVGLLRRRMIVNATNSERGLELIPLFKYARPCAYGFVDHAPGA